MILRSLFLMIFLAVTAADSYAEDSLSLDDEAFIQAFPFEKYTVAQAGGSLFYIDDSRDCIKRQLKAGTPWNQVLGNLCVSTSSPIPMSLILAPI